MRVLFLFLAVPFLFFSCNQSSIQPPVIVTLEKPLFQDSVTNIFINDTLFFAGQRVPLERKDVREKLEYELYALAFRHSRTSIVLKRLPRWSGVIDSVLKEQDLPLDLKYLAITESDLDLDVRSPAGAMGLWQLMPSTARELGLEVNEFVDQRRDPWLATAAAAQYLKKSYEKFNDWFLVASAYNRGVTGINNELEKQLVESYFDLYLNQETARYVFRILAYKLILENPSRYGYAIQEEDRYQPYAYDTLTVKATIPDMIAFAKAKQTNYAELRRLNPWLGNSDSMYLPVVKGKSYLFRLPH